MCRETHVGRHAKSITKKLETVTVAKNIGENNILKFCNLNFCVGRHVKIAVTNLEINILKF